MFNWFKSIFRKKETAIEKARRLGIRYVSLILAVSGKPRIKDDKIFVIEVASNKMVWITLHEYELSRKQHNRDYKLVSLLD